MCVSHLSNARPGRALPPPSPPPVSGVGEVLRGPSLRVAGVWADAAPTNHNTSLNTFCS